MEFFQQLSSSVLRNEDTMQFVITKKDNELTVAVMPGNSANGTPGYMIPLVLTSTPQQLDLTFFEMIAEPLTQASNMVSNIEQFNASVQKERANSGLGKKETKELDKLLQEASSQETLKNFNGAIVMLNRALTKPGADKQAIALRIKTLREKAGVGSLFGGDEPLSYDIQKEEEE